MNRLAVPFRTILAVLAQRLPPLHRQGGAGVRKELLAGFIQTDQRPLLIQGALVDVQHVLHAPDELGVLGERDAPALLQPGLEALVG